MLRLRRHALAPALLIALGACPPPQPILILPVIPLPALTPAEEKAVRSTLSAATSSESSISIPARPCPEHTARAESRGQCLPVPCGGQCRQDQRCDEIALVPRCVARDKQANSQ